MEQEKKKEPVLVKYIKDRVLNKNKNFLMLFVGSTGSGKSYASLRLAEMLDPTFDISNVSFKAKEFMNNINNLIARSEQGEEIKGKVLVWEEFGVEHNAREFMTISNRVINYFFQTSRHLNLIVIMNVPLLSYIDSATRKLLHAIGEMQSINLRTKTSKAKIKMLQTNVITGKVYPKYLRYRKGKKFYVSKKINFNLPSKELYEAYEKKKKEFTTQLNKEIMAKLEKLNNKDRDIFTETQIDYLELYKKFNENAKEVANFTNTSIRNVNKHIRRAKIRLLKQQERIEPTNPPV